MTGLVLTVGGLVLVAFVLIPQYRRRRVRHRTVSRVRARLADWQCSTSAAASLELPTTRAGGRPQSAAPARELPPTAQAQRPTPPPPKAA